MGASRTDQADIAKLLLEHKAMIDYQDKKVSSTLHTYNMSEASVVELSHWLVVSHSTDCQLYIWQVGMPGQQLFWCYWNMELKLTNWML